MSMIHFSERDEYLAACDELDHIMRNRNNERQYIVVEKDDLDIVISHLNLRGFQSQFEILGE